METIRTLAGLLDESLDHVRSLNASPLTVRTLRDHGRWFLRWLESAHGVRTADRLRADHLHAWQKHLAAHRTTRGLPLKPRSVNKLIESTRAFLRHLADRGFVTRALVEATAYVKVPQLLPASVLNHAQTRKMLNRIGTTTPEGYRDRTTLELLYSSGLRAAELLGMNLADVDFANATALVTGKGRKQRVVPIGRTALRMLESYVKAVRPFLVRDPKQTALFLDRHGQRLPYHILLQRAHYHALNAGLDVKVTPHTFRRSCTTELIRGGANLYHVKELLGHETLDTLKHYTRLTIEDLRRTHQKCHPRERGDE